MAEFLNYSDLSFDNRLDKNLKPIWMDRPPPYAYKKYDYTTHHMTAMSILTTISKSSHFEPTHPNHNAFSATFR